ncbi:MAG: 50S ribosomal protein L15 [Elusimicrobia bacterium]|nr:50S ribosomal protein L15 [Elusimicrobiota bacterium]
MALNNLSPQPGSRKKHKRIGCGEGSGHGGSATRGMKGQRSRSGDGKMIGFEGGQMPLLRRIPKQGFFNPFSMEYQIVNLQDLERVFKVGEVVTPEALKERGLVHGQGPVKVLGQGKLTCALNVNAHAFSRAAKAAIEKAGGTATVLKELRAKI